MRGNRYERGRVMPKHRASQKVPKELQARFDEITQLTDAFSHASLNDEYAGASHGTGLAAWLKPGWQFKKR
jgi:uncharacterized protein YdeI (YjbR/CyaY-like superfamily)